MIFLLSLFNHKNLKLLKNLGGSTPISDITNMLVLGEKCEIIPFSKDKNQRNKSIKLNYSSDWSLGEYQ